MSLLLTKVLPLFVYPLGAALFGALLAGVLALLRLRRTALGLLVLLLAGLWIASTPIVATTLYAPLERRYAAQPPEAEPRVDAIVLLGGMAGDARPPRQAPDFSGSVDRVLHAWRLHRAGRAPRIVIAAGSLPWVGGAPEAELLADFLVELGVPRGDLLLDTASRNTRENALETRALFDANGLETGLLVTSASHMPRALATFAAVGLELEPAPTDFLVVDGGEPTILDCLPGVDALLLSTLAIREHIGIAVYRWRGWL